MVEEHPWNLEPEMRQRLLRATLLSSLILGCLCDCPDRRTTVLNSFGNGGIVTSSNGTDGGAPIVIDSGCYYTIYLEDKVAPALPSSVSALDTDDALGRTCAQRFRGVSA